MSAEDDDSQRLSKGRWGEGGEGEGYVYLMILFDVGCFMFLSVGYNCIPSQSGLLGISF